jgi:hypothetical protein
MTGCAPAALAALRAALVDAYHTRGPHTAEDDAQAVIDALTRDGWRLIRHPTATTNDPHA